MARLRPDIEDLQDEYNEEIKKPVGSRAVTRLEKLLISFIGIQAIDPSDENSYF